MSEVISEYRKGSEEYKRLETAKSMIETFTTVKLEIKTIYFDFGQKWMYTALCVSKPNEYQLFNPRDYALIVRGSYIEFINVVTSTIIKLEQKES